MKTTYILLIILLTILLGSCLVGIARGETYYVNPATGDDYLNNGLTPETPWQTIERALPDWLGAGTKVTGGDTVILADGNYGSLVQNVPVAQSSYITYQAAEGSVPTFTKETYSPIRLYKLGSPSIDIYMKFVRLTFDSNTAAFIYNVNYVIFQDCNFVGHGYDVTPPINQSLWEYSNGLVLSQANHIILDGCLISGDGQYQDVLVDGSTVTLIEGTSVDTYEGNYTAKVAITEGSSTVTGLGTTWSSAVEGEMFYIYTGASSTDPITYPQNEYSYTIQSRVSDTELTLSSPHMAGTNAGTPNYYIYSMTDYMGTTGGIQGSEGGYGEAFRYGIYFNAACSDVNIYDCNIGSCGTAIGGVGNSDVAIRNCDIHNVTHDFIVCGNPTTGVDGLTIENNIIHDGIEIFLGGNGYNAFAHLDCIQIGGFTNSTAECKNVTIRNNKAYHTDGAFGWWRAAMYSPADNHTWIVENNLVYDNMLRNLSYPYTTPAPEISIYVLNFYNIRDIYCRNNIIIGSVQAATDGNVGYKTGFSCFTGNILKSIGLATDATLGGEPLAYAEVSYENYNLIDIVLVGMSEFDWGDNTNEAMTTEAFEALFNDYDTDDFTLASDSAAIDVGPFWLPFSALTDILGNYRMDIPSVGHNTNEGSSLYGDAGCYEYQTASDAPAITEIWATGTNDIYTGFSNGDRIYITFNMETNQSSEVTTGAGIHNYINNGGKNYGSFYYGEWITPRILRITFSDTSGGGNLAIGDTLRFMLGGLVQNAASTSAVCEDSAVIRGNFANDGIKY